jgi:hypothetical protein
VAVAPGQPIVHGERVHLKGLGEWSDDQRSALEVVEAATAPFSLTPEQLDEIPVIYEVDH